MPVLDVRSLTVRIQSESGLVHAVEDVSFSAKAGQVVALVGESGAGKSVTGMSILRLVPSPPAQVVAGEIFLDGRDLLKMSTSQIHEVRGNEVAMIFQEPMTALNPALRIWRQVGEPLVRHRALNWQQAKAKALELLALVQIADPKSRAECYPHEFSGGMRQRVMIAMALACQPKLIIADEPTTALDVTVQAQLLSLLVSLTKKLGGCLMLITHDLGVVARYVDVVNVMYAGRIVESGPVEDVLNRPQHPYTCGLIRSIPRISGALTERLDAIPGSPVSTLGGVVGCAFRPRCGQAITNCAQHRPTLKPCESGSHLSACWNP